MRTAALTSLSIAAAGALLATPLAHAQVGAPPDPKPGTPVVPQQPSIPELLSVQVHQTPKERRGEASVRVRAVARSAPLSGVSVLFSDGAAFGMSACREPSSDGRPPGPPFAPGYRVNFSIPHRFRTAPSGSLLLRIDSSLCSGSVNSVFRPFTFLHGPPSTHGRPSATSARATRVRRHTRRHGRRGRHRRRGCRRAGARVGRSRASLRVARRALLCLMNAARRRRGLRPLRSNRRLRRAASRHTRAMVRASFFSHIEPAGIGLVQRMRRVGYIRGAQRWLVGENIGFGRGAQASPLGMVRAWMGSTGHRANILAPQFREAGLGISPGTPGRSGGRGATYTTDFGVRR